MFRWIYGAFFKMRFLDTVRLDQLLVLKYEVEP